VVASLASVAAQQPQRQHSGQFGLADELDVRVGCVAAGVLRDVAAARATTASACLRVDRQLSLGYNHLAGTVPQSLGQLVLLV
jgi:hypothetical protein